MNNYNSLEIGDIFVFDIKGWYYDYNQLSNPFIGINYNNCEHRIYDDNRELTMQLLYSASTPKIKLDNERFLMGMQIIYFTEDYEPLLDKSIKKIK